MQVHYQTARYTPPRRISLRIGSLTPTDQYEGFYRDSWWTFDLGDLRPTAFRLVLDGMSVSSPFVADDMRRGQIREGEVDFVEPVLSSECGRLQRAWFPTGTDQPVWDAIVVGAGMGGGTLLYTLATRHPQLTVLGLEAGPLLLPTHAGNLARRSFAPNVNAVSDLWGLYNDLGVQPFDVTKSKEGRPLWAGKQVFALGGRSLFWGALAPRLSPGDAKVWPAELIDDLNSTYYARAETLLNVGSPDQTDLQNRVIRTLRTLPELANYAIGAAPVAIDRVRDSSWQVADGLFSTADIVLDARLNVPPNGDAAQEDWPPYLHLSELVTTVAQDPTTKEWTVYGVNVVDGTPTTHRARRVVLAAGAIETARIAIASKITAAAIGQGLTEHDMWWVHFQIPAGSPFNTGDRSVKILCVPTTDAGYDWNLQIELNTDLIENRHVPPEVAGPVIQADPGADGAQLVFLRRTPLNERQRVAPGKGQWPGFNVTAKHSSTPVTLVVEEDDDVVPTELQDVCDAVIAALYGKPLPGQDETMLRRSDRGYVAHEVGTMRMPLRDAEPGATPPVVDESLMVDGAEGLFVCDNSVFPVGPAANPSLTLCALALRLADHLAEITPAKTSTS